MPRKFPTLSRISRLLGYAFLLGVLGFVENGFAADGNIITELDLSQETIEAPPTKGLYHVASSPTETVLVQAIPGEPASREIVLTGKIDGSGAKQLHLDCQRPIGGVVYVDLEFTVREMQPNSDGPETASNVWSFILGSDDGNIIFAVDAGPSGTARFALSGIKNAQGELIPAVPWKVGQTYKLRFAFNFIRNSVDVILDGDPWVKDAALPTGQSAPGGLRALTIGDGQNIGGGAKHPSQLAISHLEICQP